MSRVITLPSISPNAFLGGRYVSVIVCVDWFPRLSDSQVIENAIARSNGSPAPHTDPNMIEVRIARPLPAPDLSPQAPSLLTSARGGMKL